MAKYSMRNGRRYEKPVQEQQLEQKEQTPAKNPWLDFFLGFITIVPFMHVRHILEEGISGHKEHKVSGFAFLIFMFIIGILCLVLKKVYSFFIYCFLLVIDFMFHL
jgi:hypothetical protein